MYAEDDLLPISALQHLLYCERQCALIHVERLWAENALTVQGRHLHEKAHGGRRESREGRRTARSLQVRSLRLGLYGVTDVVEFHPAPPTADAGGEPAPPIPFPVEYKRGRPKAHDADRVQLCAQALCLEEMLGRPVSTGALYYGKTRRREDVPFDDPLRQLTLRTVDRLHALIASGHTPPAAYERNKCDRCSLKPLCLPEAGSASAASAYLRSSLSHALSRPAASD
jgi:CRISPR-associated exonuclease Cas4